MCSQQHAGRGQIDDSFEAAPTCASSYDCREFTLWTTDTSTCDTLPACGDVGGLCIASSESGNCTGVLDPNGCVETAAPVAREVATRRSGAQVLEATASEKTVPTCVPGRSSNSVVRGTVSVAWILTGMATVTGMVTATAMATVTGTGTGTVGNGEESR
ncbi:uncharacterized protein LOC135222546 [Macrobrachium nipponense]|uniref:uncharacterized protein LOC135222546 n=1 Tax=Macrobrachium nipponense TaxID=159736 RepID=UPI0030C7BB27